MKSLIIVVFTLGLVSSFSLKTDSKTNSLELIIDSKDTIFKLSDGLITNIKIQATLLNSGDKSLHLILPGDGSQSGWRSPVLTWSVSKIVENNNSMEKNEIKPLVNFCGNINSVIESEFIELKPLNETQIVKWLGRPNIPQELGKYSIFLVYHNDPNLEWKNIGIHGYGNHDKKLLKKAKGTDEAYARSNELIVEIIE